jgi:hypothetical protein
MPDDMLWLRSSYSAQGNACVEVATLADGSRAVRDSKDADGPMIKFTAGQWQEFTVSLKS